MIEPCDKCVQDKECDGGPFCGCTCHDGILRRKDMIPEHLQGKSATQICELMRAQFFVENKVLVHERMIGNDKSVDIDKAYTRRIEGLLLLAVKDALCNADGKVLCDGDYGLMGSEAECLAIAFLNTVLPKK